MGPSATGAGGAVGPDHDARGKRVHGRGEDDGGGRDARDAHENVLTRQNLDLPLGRPVHLQPDAALAAERGDRQTVCLDGRLRELLGGGLDDLLAMRNKKSSKFFKSKL